MRRGRVFVGISGWSYDSWRGPYYPPELAKSRWLEHVGATLDSMEINGSFYSLQNPASYEKWAAAVPEGFVFAVKGSRFITHSKKLKEARTPLANFLANGLLRLEDKLGPILWQLPDNLRLAPERLAAFCDLLPRDTEEAARLAAEHDERVEGKASFAVDRPRPLRHAFEVRHPEMLNDAVVRVLRNAGIALVVSDAGRWPLVEELTAGFAYLRLHGSPHTYASRYDDEALDFWAERVEAWRSGGEPEDARRITERKPPPRKSRDVYVYFDNDQHAHAPRDAMSLRLRVRASRSTPRSAPTPPPPADP
jgi:uncharacterized protein YecE (DUF72 family)